MRRSAKPMTPRPIFLFDLVTVSICLIGYLFISMTLSRKWTDFVTTSSSLAQSNSQPVAPLVTMRLRFMEPRLQDS